ncbi:carbohydrate kinase family protein [Mesorhizobium sp. B4-1-4]|uniref:carbohydrate kinase family protein n=1 Tax=Mesorhizobium sp. B4-1-4 TaxID=2589888 RepID=UPI00112AFA4A|nr:carbohydrate kinase family protein [Mesorhizobium sp. B4-1-4]UCI32129.1 PfkB family carbohydrate kinase [Mesorhizobium sp. B4-1-4]
MEIAGGLYRELCLHPSWDAVMGSGGRAARALVDLSPNSRLHCYFESEGSFDRVKQDLAIQATFAGRHTGIVFAYFHPLSRPLLQPPLAEIKRMPAIKVEGDAVLRFGFIEGDAIVAADRAIYDPQSAQNFVPFHDNGSRASELALVLNERELRAAARTGSLADAADAMLKDKRVACVIVKRGVKGALVFSRGSLPSTVPAFLSKRIFKIGTGDIFTAAFAHHWAEAKLTPYDAAYLASMHVASYCDNPHAPLTPPNPSEAVERHPISDTGNVLLLGAIDTLGRRYTIEEARFGLAELGLNAICPALEAVELERMHLSTVLMLVDGIDQEGIRTAKRLNDEGVRCIALVEARSLEPLLANFANCETTEDFSTALYLSGWSA